MRRAVVLLMLALGLAAALVRVEGGSGFASQDACVSYAAQGGEIAPVVTQGPVSIRGGTTRTSTRCDFEYRISGLVGGSLVSTYLAFVYDASGNTLARTGEMGCL